MVDPTQPLEPVRGDFGSREAPPVPWHLRRPSPAMEAWLFAGTGLLLLAVGLGWQFGWWLALVVVGAAFLAAGLTVEDGVVAHRTNERKVP